MGKFSLSKVVGFLNHHTHDLDAVAALAQGLLAAVPVNAETRASINQAITRVTDSATAIRSSLEAMDLLHDDTAHVSPDTAMASLLGSDDGKAMLSRMMREWLDAHPQAGGVVPQMDQGAATAAKAGDQMQAGDRSGQQQRGQGDAVVSRVEPQDGTKRQEDAPAPSSPTDADKSGADTTAKASDAPATGA